MFTTLTFNWRGVVSPRRATESLKELSFKLDSYRLGSRFYEHSFPDRTLFVFVPEKLTSYPHFHGLVRVPDDPRHTYTCPEFAEFTARCWREIVPSGTCYSVPLMDGGALQYSTKENSLDHDLTSCSVDFWSSKGRSNYNT